MMKHHRKGDAAASWAAAPLLVAALGSTTLAMPSLAAAASCAGDAGGIALPLGFCATVFADKVGHVRHAAVAPDGTVYVNDWSGRYYKNDVAPPEGGFLVALRDTDGDGRADEVARFGGTVRSGSAGGTGIALHGGYVYAEDDDRIERYRLPSPDGGGAPRGEPEVVLSGMPLSGDHPMHPFVIDEAGNLYVDMGSATNACQAQNRMPGAPGQEPCTELETRGGTWRYDANRLGQRFSPAERYATGIRNGEGFSFDASGRLYGTQHGRDQLSQNWGKLYDARQGVELPSEELLLIERGADFGWPECYFDPTRGELMLAPEYGGDGGKTGVCTQKRPPVAAFPAHWAPNDLLIYQGPQFPKAYQGGAFIAFHGSWNRAPAPQGGYNVVFQPLADGKASGPYVVFADGFAGANKEPGRAVHRPSGLAAGPDGALYVTDDQNGRIWRVTYRGGDASARVAAATSPAPGATSSPEVLPPEGVHADAGSQASAPLPTPAGAKPEQVALGGRIFRGEAAGGTCGGCHGGDAAGSPIGPDLTSGQWRWGDGSLPAIRRTITEGVAQPKEFTGAMPPMGGADLSPADVDALAAYVWAVGHRRG